MKKIMFNDKMCLTQAVLEGRKTQTRRIMKGKPLFPTDEIESAGILGDEVQIIANGGESLITMKLPFKKGEVVAVAQSYCSIAEELENCKNATCAAHYEKNVQKASEYISWMEHPGFNNKMFVAADKMIHRIRITDVRVECLQDIPDEDSFKEGVELNTRQYEYDGTKYYCVRGLGYWRGFGCTNFHTPREAFAALIDKVNGKGTWERNPYVFVYDFELVK